jgi:predicted membrane protein
MGLDERNMPDAGTAEQQPTVPATRWRWVVSVFGDITRRGSWPSGNRFSPVAVFGDIDLDFREAGPVAGQVAIDAVAPFGNIDVLVPDGVQVDVDGFTLLGSKKISVGDRSTNKSAPVLRVRAFSLLGSVKVSSEASRSRRG